MDEWLDILPFVSYRKVVWFSQCSQLFQAISESHLPARWKKKGLKGCAANGDLEGVKYLVKRCGADVHEDDERALREASRNGHLEVVKYLVEEGGAKVYTRTWFGDYALRAATQNGRLEVMHYLVERCGADPHARKDEMRDSDFEYYKQHPGMPMPANMQSWYAHESQARLRRAIPDDFYDEAIKTLPPSSSFWEHGGPPLLAIYWRYRLSQIEIITSASSSSSQASGP